MRRQNRGETGEPPTSCFCFSFSALSRSFSAFLSAFSFAFRAFLALLSAGESRVDMMFGGVGDRASTWTDF